MALDSPVHVKPPEGDGDAVHHTDPDGVCWCQPRIEWEDPVTQRRIYVHKESLD